MNIIQDIYNDYIHSQNEEYKKLYEGYEDWYGASSVGQCYRKQWYRTHDTPEKEMDEGTRRLLRLGTILHRDIEKAIETSGKSIMKMRNENVEFYLEETVKLPDLKVIGHLDIAVVKGEDFDNWDVSIYDVKTAKAFAWQKRFGLRKNRDPNPSRNYEMQVSTYALGFADKIGCDTDDIDMFILWYKKDDSIMKTMKVSPDYIQYAINYWIDLNETLEDINSPDEMIPFEEPNVPVQDWECSYCAYTNVCDGKDRLNKIKQQRRGYGTKRKRTNIPRAYKR